MKDDLTDDLKDVSRSVNTQKFFIVGANDFTTSELITLDSLMTNTLADARWALNVSAFVATFSDTDSPYPFMNGYTEYNNVNIQPILSQYPWSMPF